MYLLLPLFLFLTLAAADLASDLRALLSPGARVVVPNDADWTDLTVRWDPFSSPTLLVSVEAATVADVVATVRYANARKIPLLVSNTSHGFTDTVKAIANGIQLSMRRFNFVSIEAAKNTVTLGGGTTVHDIVPRLFERRKRMPSGNCDCVGMLGSGLGGGHGRLQGLHGLVSDNILSAQLVLANGTLITVSATEHKELYWAIRGAGHNFGVVTEMTVRIYDAEDADMWTNAAYLYPGARVEELFTFLNGYKRVQPAELTIFVGLANSAEGANIRLSIQYGGHVPFEDVAKPFLEMKPTSISNATVAMKDLSKATGIGQGMRLCIGGTRRGHFSTQLKEFKIPAVQKMVAFYEDTANTYPQFAQSSVVWEMYPLQGFRKFDAGSSAYPHRNLDMISLFMVNWNSTSDDELAREIGNKARDILLESAGEEGWQTYVNYALGDESNEVVYGSEKWRQARLQKLKRRYDPGGVFNAYNPILLK